MENKQPSKEESERWGSGNWLEIDGVVCDKRHIVRQGNSRDPRIQVRHEGATRRTFCQQIHKW